MKHRNRPAQIRNPQITAKCVACQHKEILSQQQMDDAKRDGTATCSKCFSPMLVVSIAAAIQ
jgi:transcription elongation factor Elf1